MTERRLPIGIQSFEEIRENGYVYVDKTMYLSRMLQQGKVYLLSRPGRFGKSLFTSMAKTFFEGKKELFNGLEIGKTEQKWDCYPVILFSLSGGDFHAENGLSDLLSSVIENTMLQYHLSGINGETLPVRFRNLIEQLAIHSGKQVVVLVDEYDKPLLETMTANPEQEEKNRRLYKSFFSVLKDEDQYLKFVFFTGVTKFTKVSVFSDLNQLRDISMTDDYAEICGITQKELERSFQPEIGRLQQALSLTEKQCMKELARMYDGYHFSKDAQGVYNPFSLLNAFQDKDLKQYWFATGTPTFLINRLKKSGFTAEDFSQGVSATEFSLMDYQENNPDPIPLLYQSGYLTITGWNSRFRVYSLSFPNDEVKYGFINSLVDTIIPKNENRPGFFVMNFVQDLEKGNVGSFMNRLSAVFAGIPYSEHTKSYESEWRNEIYLLLQLMGMNVQCEVHTAKGRADCIVETEKYIYVFEFKLDQTADAAMKQIEEKKYAGRYSADSREVIKVGVSFSSEKRNIDNWKTAA